MFGNSNNYHPYWTKSVKSDLSFVPTTPSVWVPNALVTDMGIYVRMGTYYNHHYGCQPYYVPSQFSHHPGSSMKSGQFIEIVNSPASSEEGVCELSRKIRRVRHNKKIKYRISYQPDDEVEEENKQQHHIATRDILADDDGDQRFCETMEIGEKDFLLPPPSQPKKKWLKHYMNGNKFLL